MSPRDELEAMLRACVVEDASDLHLTPGQRPMVRVQGRLEPLAGHAPLTPEDLDRLAQVLLAAGRDGLDARGAQDGALGAAGARFRFNVFRRQGALAVALRRLEDRFRGLADLGLPESLYELCELPDGLVVVAGPTGSGKSTTLAALLARLNGARRCHIVTIEDPIEYVHPPREALINQRQVGLDAPDFHAALVAALRQDPDVILVGEVRDLPTIRTAITAAETGHLVFTTVHAGDCVGAVERLTAAFPADEQVGVRRQLGMVLRAIVAQHLVPADGHAAALDAGARRRRVVVSEVLRGTPAVQHLVATGKSPQIYSAMEAGAGQGMQTLEQDLARLWVDGHLAETTALTMARSPNVLRDRAALLRREGAARAATRRLR